MVEEFTMATGRASSDATPRGLGFFFLGGSGVASLSARATDFRAGPVSGIAGRL